MSWLLHEHPHVDGLSEAVAAQLEGAIHAGLADGGRATLALAGGRTPWPAYALLARAALDWRRTTLMPTDERCVPLTHPASNLRGLAAAFAGVAGEQREDGTIPDDGVRLRSLAVPDGDPAASEAHARAMLAAHPRPFDAVLLGMGEDAHIASLFPGAPRLDDGYDCALDACRIDSDPLPPEAPWPRISLTLPRLLRSSDLLLVVTGRRKREVLEQAFARADPFRSPASVLLHAPGALVHVHWSP